MSCSSAVWSIMPPQPTAANEAVMGVSAVTGEGVDALHVEVARARAGALEHLDRAQVRAALAHVLGLDDEDGNVLEQRPASIRCDSQAELGSTLLVGSAGIRAVPAIASRKRGH